MFLFFPILNRRKVGFIFRVDLYTEPHGRVSGGFSERYGGQVDELIRLGVQGFVKSSAKRQNRPAPFTWCQDSILAMLLPQDMPLHEPFMPTTSSILRMETPLHPPKTPLFFERHGSSCNPSGSLVPTARKTTVVGPMGSKKNHRMSA